MSNDTLVTYVATYPSTQMAKDDFANLKALSSDSAITGYDAAVVSHTDDNKVHIVETHETPTRKGALEGLGIGLAVGLVAAAFPAVALTGGLMAGTGVAGSVIGAVTGHVTGGMNRGDLKDLAEALDRGSACVVYVGTADVADEVKKALKNATDITTKPVNADRDKANADADTAAAKGNAKANA